MLGKSKGSSNSNSNSGRVIIRARDKPKPPCKKCKRSKKSKKSKKKKCTICNGIYPIPYPGKSYWKVIVHLISICKSFLIDFFLLFEYQNDHSTHRGSVIANGLNCKHRQFIKLKLRQQKRQILDFIPSFNAVQWPYFHVFIFTCFHHLKNERTMIQYQFLFSK